MGEWKEYKIKDLGLVVTGKTPSSAFPEEFGSEMPFVTPTDFRNYRKRASFAERNLSAKGIEKLRNKVLPPSSVLVTCIGSDMGKIVMNRVPVITNQQINAIIPNQELVSPDFLYYMLVDCYETLRMYSQAGTAVPILNKGDFEEINLTIPSISSISNCTTLGKIPVGGNQSGKEVQTNESGRERIHRHTVGQGGKPQKHWERTGAESFLYQP